MSEKPKTIVPKVFVTQGLYTRSITLDYIRMSAVEFKVQYGPDDNRITERPRYMISCVDEEDETEIQEHSLVLSKYDNEGVYIGDIFIVRLPMKNTSVVDLWDLARSTIEKRDVKLRMNNAMDNACVVV